MMKFVSWIIFFWRIFVSYKSLCQSI